MKCPKCGYALDLMQKWGKLGGLKSRRTLTTEQAKEMVRKREEKRLKKPDSSS